MRALLVIFSLTYVILFLGCEKDKNEIILIDDTHQNVVDFSATTEFRSYPEHNELIQDTAFRNYVLDECGLMDEIQDLDSLNMYLEIEHENFTISVLEEIAIFLGFTSAQEYLDFVDVQFERLNYTDSLYSINALDSLEMVYVVGEIMDENEIEFRALTCEEQCKRIEENCVAGAIGGAALGHLGCILADVTGPLGALCHGLVVGVIGNKIRGCQLNGRHCIQQCTG